MNNKNILYYYNKRKTMILTLIIWIIFIPLNILFFKNGIYGEIIEVDLFFMFKRMIIDMFFYDIVALIILIFLVIKFIKELLNKENDNILITKRDTFKNYLQFFLIIIANIIFYFMFSEHSALFNFICIFGLTYIIIFEGIKNLL